MPVLLAVLAALVAAPLPAGARGVLALPMDPQTIRAVTNLMVSTEDIQNAIRIISEAV